MFSAVALVAFSFAGMASTGGEEKLNNQLEKVKESETPCTDQWSDDVDFLMDYYDATFAEANAVANHAWEACLDEMYGG
tara:strand:+ start:274 stop:510 length:237 start_codon:yes stop_codon:yes gene_type:complete